MTSVMLLNYKGRWHRLVGMKHILLSSALILSMASGAQAACFAHYKAKQENPLKLAYGIMSVGDAQCSATAAKATVKNRLLQNGWVLLNIVRVTTKAPTTSEERNAGAHYLRF